MDNKSDGNFSNYSIEVSASSKQTASTPNDVSSAGVEFKINDRYNWAARRK